MNKIVSRIVGLLILIGVWVLFLTPRADTSNDQTDSYIFTYGIVLLWGLVYSLFYQKNYPVQVVLVVFAVELILVRLEGQGVERILFGVFILQINLFLGQIIAICGPLVDKGFTFALSPLQEFLNSIGLRMSIPVIAGIVILIVSYILINLGIIYTY